MLILKKFILFLAGKRKRLDNLDLNNISSILIKPIGDAIGDAIAHTAHLNQLRKFNSKLKIAVIVTERNKIIFQNSGLVDELIEHNIMNYYKQRGKWDLYLDFQPTFTTKTILLEKILSPKYIAIFNKHNKKHYNISTVKNFNLYFPMDETTHISDYLSKSVLGSYLYPDSAVYYLQQMKVDSKFTESLWKNKCVKVLISPQGSNREIPVDEIAVLLNNLDNKIKNKVHFLLSVTQNREEYSSDLIKKISKEILISILPKTTLNEYLDVVRSSDFVISVDSGTVHISCALNKPLFAFYADNQKNLKKWYPKPSEQSIFDVIKSTVESDSNHTCDFNMHEAANLLNLRLENIEKSNI